MTASKAMFRLTANPPFRAVNGRFIKAESELISEKREMIRDEAARMRDLAQDEAPKKTGQFAANIRYQTFVTGETTGFKVTTPQPLGRWILEGTKAHPIPIPARPPGKPLHFYWANGPRGAGMYTYFNVSHPGTKPNRFIGRAYRRWLPGARVALSHIARSFTRKIVGGGTESKSLTP